MIYGCSPPPSSPRHVNSLQVVAKLQALEAGVVQLFRAPGLTASATANLIAKCHAAGLTNVTGITSEFVRSLPQLSKRQPLPLQHAAPVCTGSRRCTMLHVCSLMLRVARSGRLVPRYVRALGSKPGNLGKLISVRASSRLLSHGAGTLTKRSSQPHCTHAPARRHRILTLIIVVFQAEMENSVTGGRGACSASTSR